MDPAEAKAAVGASGGLKISGEQAPLGACKELTNFVIGTASWAVVSLRLERDKIDRLRANVPGNLDSPRVLERRRFWTAHRTSGRDVWSMGSGGRPDAAG
jgi:hypothetical protein